jgi:tetratricopeptide (TPR) repeat protein
MRFFARASIVLFLSLSASACAGNRGKPPSGGERNTAATMQVSDDQFAAAVHDLLLTEPGTNERAVRLGGVEARQMARAVQRFKMKQPDRGLTAVMGGLALIRVGELAPNTLGPDGVTALRLAARELAARGDEGRARAIYEMLNKLSPDADTKGHLDALAQWTRDAVARGGPLQSAGALERVAVRRRLLEPSPQALEDAINATTDWIKRGLQMRAAYKQTRQVPSREEATEAYRALQSGPAVLAALHLRDADANGALATLDKAGVKEMLFPELVHALEAVAEMPIAARWLDVLHALRPLTGRDPQMREEDDFSEDRDLFQAAAFSVALETYRLDPTLPESAGMIAAVLQEAGMAEATPAVVLEATKAHANDPRTVSGAMAITIRAMNEEVESGNVEAARRTFRAALPLLGIADGRSLAGKVQPSSARVRAVMGDLELREGRAEEARALLKASAAVEKSGAVLLTLARIEWHDKQAGPALENLKQALTAEDTLKDGALRGEILLHISDITREQGDMSAARTPLNEALRELARARNEREPEHRARAERVLSRVLDRFGQPQPAQRALERAFAAAPRDKHQAAATTGHIVGRAFVRGDLPGARDGLTRAVAADLDTEDLVYYALWVRLLERQLKQASDGAPDRIFKTVNDDGSWMGKLAAYGAGKIKGADLIAAAKTPSQKTEAQFYAAMDLRVAGDTKGADEALKNLITPAGVQLMEVSLAKELLLGGKGQLGGPLPSDVSIP